MPKKYTKTDDGWVKVEEYEEKPIVPDDSELYKNNYYNRFRRDQELKEFEETKKINISQSMPELVVSDGVASVAIKPTKKKKTSESEDWKREADRAALIAVAWIFGIMALLGGILALLVWLIPGFTWQTITEYVIWGLLQVIYWIWKAFQTMCYAFFDWIFKICGGQW